MTGCVSWRSVLQPVAWGVSGWGALQAAKQWCAKKGDATAATAAGHNRSQNVTDSTHMCIPAQPQHVPAHATAAEVLPT